MIFDSSFIPFHLSMVIVFCLLWIRPQRTLFSLQNQVIWFGGYFFITGYSLQIMMMIISDQPLVWWFAIIVSAMLAFILVILLKQHIKTLTFQPNLMSTQHFLGQIAVICDPKAKVGKPAQATLRDASGQLHIVWVEPESGELIQGQQVILIKLKSTYYTVKEIVPLNRE